MKRLLPALAIIYFGLSTFCIAADDDEISLFDSTGTATAYIAEELTIYLWSGKPVAYLDTDDAGGFSTSVDSMVSISVGLWAGSYETIMGKQSVQSRKLLPLPPNSSHLRASSSSSLSRR